MAALEAIRKGQVQLARVVVAVQVGLVLLVRLRFPVMINSQLQPLTIYNAAAPESTLRYLLYALVIGSVIIFPALVYLMKVFKLSETDRAH